MKKILIMRHAKSDWSDNSLSDFDRPLNKRGKKAAPVMGEEIKKRKLTPDVIISSPAKRAKRTAKIVAEKCGYDKKIIFNEDFYFGYVNDVFKAVKNLPNKKKSVMLFGHNPTWEHLVELLAGEYVIMPTAALAVLHFKSDNWQNLKKYSCELVLHIKPKDFK